MCIKALYKLIDSSSDIVVRCPLCFESMTFGHYYHQHALKEHSLKNPKECVFCMGFKSWPHGQKMKRENVKPVVECLKGFVAQRKGDDRPPDYDYFEGVTCDFISMPHYMHDRCKDPTYVGFYDSVFEKPDMWPRGIEFSEASGLGKDVHGIIQRYLSQDMDLFHIMVKHDAFPIFCREMEQIRDEFVLLPFWCLCDGLEGKIQHRHMILACEPESSFKEIWKHKIRYNFPNQGRAKKCVKIRDAFHLARTIVYVSQPKAMCDGRIPENVGEGKCTSHFHINRPMHEHSIVFLCTLFPNGIERLLAEQNGNKNVVLWDIHAQRSPDKWRHLRWVVPIKVTGRKFIHCQVPFNGQEESYLMLHGDKKIVFKPGYSLQILKVEMYVLSPKQQNVLKQLREIKEKVQMERDDYWKTIVVDLNMGRDVFKNEYKLKENEWKAERDVLKSERDTFKAKRNVFKTERDNLLLENCGLRRMLINVTKMFSDSLQR
ncbi:uncharacterized protein TNIN_277681 [Trichonephila inaurata madagascariensis]|uniref:C2H2-type domain-containing protein n=1 Tax=Trichonephila inaurata madagascariensis TaxID=2747483 RepID=A0A8X6XRX4_9ARAC|nr:uncharacterized protein TNIN_97871 [Trichonephila inaurata madagascariensis]GFY59093.1 uncharacterized protein TNIN_277681 [Trichonephila inaurata madagascariensis]